MRELKKMIAEKILKTTGEKTKKRYIHFGLKEEFHDGEVVIQHKEDYLLQREKYQELEEENQKIKTELKNLKEFINNESKSLLEEVKEHNNKEVSFLKDLLDKKDNLLKEDKEGINQLHQKIQQLTEEKAESVSKFMFILSDLASENSIERLIYNKPKKILNKMKENKELKNIPTYEAVLSEFSEEEK